MNEFKVAHKTVGPGNPTFIIAEIGNNHNGSLSLAKELVDHAVEAGVDAVKFQMRDMGEVYGESIENKSAVDLGAQYALDILEKYQLTNDQLFEVFDYCKTRNILSFCTPWDPKSVKALDEYGVELFKIASADLTNHPLLESVAATKKPLICSTGMATEAEIESAANLLKSLKAAFSLLHCNSTYPAPFKDINLTYMNTLKQWCPIVGYSGHERGYHVPIAAVAMGATIIEKHFTVDKSMEGVDHKVSLLPIEMKAMVAQIRDVESALRGQEEPRSLSQGELINRESLAKSITAATSIKEGQLIDESMIAMRSPGQGLPPYMKDKIVGTRAGRVFSKGEVFFSSDLPGGKQTTAQDYQFTRPWGIPVRYHDTDKFLEVCHPDFVEFHLSYQDMEDDFTQFLKPKYDQLQFTVHAPELFAQDHILDLCARSASYLETSRKHLHDVVNLTKRLKPLFPNTKRPFIVATIGGFTENQPLEKPEREKLYRILGENLKEFVSPEVEVLPQSAAPFPWHQGGQQYQNLFVFPEEIIEFCQTYKHRICLDVSHSYLSCNHFDIDPKFFFESVAPFTAHIHMGDSKGVDGEGLQIGEGVVDFDMLGDIFKNHCPDAWFIPEIWQGHKNLGEGFWIALDRLNGKL